jgi:hypothetical protein
MHSGKKIAQAALRLAVIISPAERREWSRAMQAETHNISSDKALLFAVGCLRAMVHARATDGNTLLIVARWTLVLGALVWSALHFRLAGQLSASNVSIPSTLVYVAAVAIALGAFFTAVKGLHATFVLAAPVALLSGLVAVGVDYLLPQSPYSHFYKAIAIEYVVILLVGMLIAIGVPYWVVRRERPIV